MIIQKAKPSIFREDTVLVDRTGAEWKIGPEYQERDPQAKGWFQLQSKSECMGFSDVLAIRGFLNSEGERFLVVINRG